MKKNRYVLLVLLSLMLGFVLSLRAQSTEVQQLLLNVEKLSQLKNILSDMKKGYTVVRTGYNAIKDISRGNFSLHEFFLDGLLLVSPEVKKYWRVLDIIRMQKDLVAEYRSAFKAFKSSGNFSVGELEYLGRVYGQLFDQSLDNLDELAMVITSSKLRMSDEERLQVIDRIFAGVQDKLMFLRHFNEQGLMLSKQRDQERLELESSREIYGLN